MVSAPTPRCRARCFPRRLSLRLCGPGWVLSLVLCLLLSGCGRQDEEQGLPVLVFKHGKIAGDPEAFRETLNRFEAETGIRVRDETLPASSDEQHQFYVINLEGRSADFDVLSMDVIWVPEFARAGWLREVDHLVPAGERECFFPGPLEAVTFNNHLYALPWYLDAGLLYYRKDLLQKHGLPPPKTWPQLVESARVIVEREPGVYGFIWQGKQYEGLVCNVLEYFWGNGGEVLSQGRPILCSEENIEALRFMVDLIGEQGVTPPFVTTLVEESTRHIFGNGKAVFMRNWPYAWTIFEREGSAVKGKVGVCPLPAFPGREPAACLGGWQVGINKFSRHPVWAEKLVKFLASAETQKAMALAIGYKPTRRSLYGDPELIAQQPFVPVLYEVFMKAKPRPVSPYYLMITQVLQPEFSAAISEIKTPEQALGSAQKQIAHILGGLQ